MVGKQDVSFAFIKNSTILQFRFVLIVVFIACPFAGMLLSICAIVRRHDEKLAISLIILFFGLLGYTFMPLSNDDLPRHYMMFDKLKLAETLPEFIFYQSQSEKPDFFLYLLYWLTGKLVNTHQVVGFLGAICYYGLGLGVILHWRPLLKVQSFFYNFLLPAGMFLSLMPVTEFSGMRQGNANMLFLFIVTIPDEKLSKLKRVLLLLFPCLIHFSLWPVVLLYICTFLFRRKMVFMLSLCLLASFFFFVQLMTMLTEILSTFGSIGAGMAGKINDYFFAGKIDNALYSGSVLRFVIILFSVLVLPFIIYGVDKNRRAMPSSVLRIHYFTFLFFSYTVFTCSSFILSRTMMLFKLLVTLYFTYALFSCNLKWYTKRFLLCLCMLIFLSGPFFMYLGKEYRSLNFSIFHLNLFGLLDITTLPEGY